MQRTTLHYAPEATDFQENISEQFLEALDAPGAVFSFQTFDDLKDRKDPSMVRVLSGSFAQHKAELLRLNRLGAGIFVTVNRTDGEGRKTENITGIRAVFLDLDGPPLPKEWPIEPHLIVESSPGRYHGYWLLESGFPLDRFSPVQKSIAAMFGGDKSVHDLGRVLRIPGFLHRKNEPFVSRIVREWSTDPPYTADQILAVFPPSEEKTSGKTKTGKDPVLASIEEKGLLIGPGRENGMFRIRCPWASEHTTGEEEAVFYLPHFGGFSGYGFKCLHAHCDGKTIKNLMGFLNISPEAGSLVIHPVSDLWDDAEDEISWTVEKLLPEGSLGILGGRPKDGKSTLARNLALSVASGRPFLGDLEVLEGDVVYMALEENRRSVVRQFKTLAMKGFGMTEEEAKTTLHRIALICGPPPVNVVPKLKKLVDEHHPAMIIVDTMIRLLRLKDSNDYAETSRELEDILHLAHESGSSILLLHHTKKGDAGDLLGSTGIQSAPDVLLTLGRKDDTRTLSAWGRGVLFDPVTLQFDREGLSYTMGIPMGEAEILSMMDRIVEFIKKNDTGDGVPWKKIREEVEGRTAEKDTALRRIREEGKVVELGVPKSRTDPLRFRLPPGG